MVDRLKGKQVLLYLSENAGPPFIATPKIADDVAFSLGTKDEVVAASRQNAALGYGDVSVVAMALVMNKIPRIDWKKAGTTDAAPAVCE